MNYLGSSSANVNGLQTVVQNLKARRNDEKSTLKAAENAGRVMTDVASNWFRSIHEIELEADAIEKEYNQGRCAGGWCVNCWSRYKLSKMSIELSLKAESRLNDQFVVARQPSPKSVIEIESEPIENQPSTQQLLLKMLDCIGDPEIGIIGVYGMGGVGKTTLAGKVNNHYKVNSCFETVIMVSVSATPNIRSIQTSISKRIGLDLSNDNEDDAREKLFDALRKKKFLLILDDVWRRLELKDIGIPHPRNQHKGSKILVTSRSQDACTDMGARKIIKVEPLSKDESWNLFIEKAGQHVAANHLKCFAEKIVGRCKGLPLAIVTVARAMANRHGVGEWTNAAREMEQSATDLRGMKEEVFVPLKFSFDRLEDDMLRSLFLYCACFPEDYNIGKDEIVNYCVGEGFADRLGSLTAARNKCEALIGSLKIACLLEDGEDEGSVRMHDMIRELALGITSSDYDSSPKFLIRTGESFKEAPKASEWLHATRISLMHTQIKEFPQLVGKCQKLVTLLLSYNRILTVPPTNFLQHMEGLSVLDLSYTYTLEYLPDSLSCLVNLRVLRLRGCSSLRALPALEMLQQLQVLDLSYCQMLDQQIFGSECMGCISNLRYFDVGETKVSIPAGIISRLLKLEQSSLFKAYKIKWKVSAENEKWDGSGSDCRGQRDEGNNDDQESSGSNGSHQPSIIDVGELSHLTQLTSLSISFNGIIISDWFKPLAKKMMELLLEHCTIKQGTIQALNECNYLRWLHIQKCTGLTCVPTRVEEYLGIGGCEDLEKVLDGANAGHDSFQRLKDLFLSRLPKLESICVGIAPLNFFGKLRQIDIWYCSRLKMVFTKEMPSLFNELTLIRVVDCDRMEVIIEVEEEGGKMEGSSSNNGVISPFPKLRELNLQDLPALADVCSNHILHCPLIGLVRVNKCPKLKKDPLHIRNVDGLLIIQEIMWEGKVMQEEIQET